MGQSEITKQGVITFRDALLRDCNPPFWSGEWAIQHVPLPTGVARFEKSKVVKLRATGSYPYNVEMDWTTLLEWVLHLQ